jgi:hypothetical protein
MDIKSIKKEMSETKRELFEVIILNCQEAYREGKEHAFEDAHPDVGMHFPKTFEDTEIYKELKKWLNS